MRIVLVENRNFQDALAVYTLSWQKSHMGICSRSFLQNRDYEGFLRKNWAVCT